MGQNPEKIYIPGLQTTDCWKEGGEVGRRGAEASSMRPGTFSNSARIPFWQIFQGLRKGQIPA